MQLLSVWLGDCFWPVGCLAVWLLVVGCLLVHWCCKVTSKQCLTTLCGFHGAGIVWLVCWLFVGSALVCWLVGCWLLGCWYLGLLIVCWFFVWLVGGWVLGVWLFVGFIDCLLVCWMFFFWLGCCCIWQAVLEVGLKVQVALWRTWALPASPLRRNTRLTWSPTTSFVCLCLGFVFSFAFVQHCQPAPWEGIGASHKIITNLQMFKPPRMSPREICLLIACSTRWMHVPNVYLSHPGLWKVCW